MWTKDYPTEAGWWWLYDPNHFSIGDQPYIVRVEGTDNGEFVFFVEDMLMQQSDLSRRALWQKVKLYEGEFPQ